MIIPSENNNSCALSVDSISPVHSYAIVRGGAIINRSCSAAALLVSGRISKNCLLGEKEVEYDL